jgi:hypothetical protein
MRESFDLRGACTLLPLETRADLSLPEVASLHEDLFKWSGSMVGPAAGAASHFDFRPLLACSRAFPTVASKVRLAAGAASHFGFDSLLASSRDFPKVAVVAAATTLLLRLDGAEPIVSTYVCGVSGGGPHQKTF